MSSDELIEAERESEAPEGTDSGSWALALGIGAGLTAATVAIALYLRARHPDQHIKDIDEIIDGVQERIRQLQTMIDAHRKPLSAQ